MKNLTRFLVLSLLSLYPVSEALAQPQEVSDILSLAVNGDDRNFEPAVASDSQGDYVVVWDRYLDQEESRAEVVFRKYKSGDKPITARREVNQYRTGWQHEHDVAMNGAGLFAVAWTSNDQDGSSTGVYARLYAGRKPVTGEIQVPSSVVGIQRLPRVAVDGAGNFVVVWEGQTNSAPGSVADIVARRFDKTGKPLGKSYLVNTHVLGFQTDAAVAMRPDGQHVVVWKSFRQDGPTGSIYARRFDAQGRPLGGEIRINQSSIPSFVASTAVAMRPDGSFVVAWDRCNSADFPAGCSVLLRRYDASGRPRSNETRVSFEDTDRHVSPEVAFAGNGSFAVTWNLCQSDAQGLNRGCRIATRFYDRQGRPYSHVPIVDSTINLLSPAITALGDDEFLVAWFSQVCDTVSCGAGPGGVFAQRYRLE